MKKLDNLTDDANQTLRAILDDGSVVAITLNYLPSIQRWTIDVTYGTRVYLGLNVCIHPNLMRQWSNILPFGILCNSTDGADPVLVDDFSSSRINLFILNSAEVQTIETVLIGG